jgi:type IV pilus assembly protein PilA
MLGETPRGEPTLKKLHTRKGGFTLIELMIVVAIIGILAAIAIPNFLRFQLKAKSSEGKTNIAAIRTAEQSYYSEFGSFVSATASPATVGQNAKTDFSNTDGMFDTLGWSPEGQVYFSYGVGVSMNAYTASASADIDADATYQGWGYKKLDSGGNAATPKTLAGGLVCANANLQNQVVGPCAPTHGQSVF